MSDVVTWGYDEYQQMNVEMYATQNYLPALQAAILAPSIFMQDLRNFELTFDAIIHHLEIALSKALDATEKDTVHKVAQELFHGHIFLIEQKIGYMRALNQRGVGTKIKDFFKAKDNKSVQEPEFVMPTGLAMTSKVFIKAEIALLIAEYFERLHREWKINKKQDIFFVQLARTYRKILASKIYSSDFSLIDNTIDRNKIDIVNGIVAQKDWDEGIEFMATLDFRKPAFNYSVLKGNFFRGYRKYCINRSFIATYFFCCAVGIVGLLLYKWCTKQNWDSWMKNICGLVILVLCIGLMRHEHRVILLKLKIRKRVKAFRA